LRRRQSRETTDGEPDRLVTGGGGADLCHLLSEWRRDKAELLRRFDAAGNGEIGLQEWGRARQSAEQEPSRNHLEIRIRDDFHMMRTPADGRLYLIANLPPAKLARRYRLWSWLHLSAVLLGAGVMPILLGRRPERPYDEHHARGNTTAGFADCRPGHGRKWRHR
jgi:hypothetical protein